MGFVSNVLRYFICELLVASEAFKMNKTFVSNISNLIKKYNVAQLYHFSAFLALRRFCFDIGKEDKIQFFFNIIYYFRHFL